MFHFPGSWYVGTALQWLINIWLVLEFWPFSQCNPVDWDDHERRGAGSWVILILLITAVVVVSLIATGVI